jgi:hypothetical protein
MEAIEKIKKVLTAAGFSQNDMQGLEVVGNGAKKVAGFIVSEKFNNVSPSERQNILWDIFESKLTPEERQKVVAIVTLTPDELEDYQHDDASVVKA